MLENPKRYTITAALPYTNGPIHIGHLAGVYVPSDIYSRYLRLQGKDVAFICGSDEHGVAISMKAKKEGITPQQVIDKYDGIIRQSFLDFKINYKISKVLKNIGEITVRSSLTDYTFVISDTLLENQARLLAEINKVHDIFYTSSRGVNETNIVVSASIDSIIDTIFRSEKLTHKIEDLSSITVKLPQENISTPGVYYYIFQRLAWEGIIIHEVISTTNEFTIIVSDDQIDIAFKVIKDLKNVLD